MPKKHFEIANGKAIGKMPSGMEISGVKHKDFVLREALVSDLMTAENNNESGGAVSYNANLACLTLESVGSYTGPFTENMVARLKARDWQALRVAMEALNYGGESGESEAGDDATS